MNKSPATSFFFDNLPTGVQEQIIKSLPRKSQLAIASISKEKNKHIKNLLINEDIKAVAACINSLFSENNYKTRIKENAVSAIKNRLISFPLFTKLSISAILILFDSKNGYKLITEKLISLHQALLLHDRLLYAIAANFNLIYIKPTCMEEIVQKFSDETVNIFELQNETEIQNSLNDYLEKQHDESVLSHIEKHPNYARSDDADKSLMNKPVGSFILRPCSIPGIMVVCLITSRKNTLSLEKFKIDLKILQENYKNGIAIDTYLAGYFSQEDLLINLPNVASVSASF